MVVEEFDHDKCLALAECKAVDDVTFKLVIHKAVEFTFVFSKNDSTVNSEDAWMVCKPHEWIRIHSIVFTPTFNQYHPVKVN